MRKSSIFAALAATLGVAPGLLAGPWARRAARKTPSSINGGARRHKANARAQRKARRARGRA